MSENLDRNIKKLLRSAGEPEPPRAGAADRVFDRLVERLDEERKPVRRRGVRWAALAALAAAACLLIVAQPFGPDAPTVPDEPGTDTNVAIAPTSEVVELRTDAGQTLSKKLKDGSSVELAGDSLVEVTTWPDRPRPYLRLRKGSVRSKVAKGKGLFTVATAVGEATALGTEYTVSLTKKEADKGGANVNSKILNGLVMTVAVLSGEVLVSDLTNASQLVAAGEEVKVGDKATTEAKVAEKVSSGSLIPRLEDGTLGEPLEVRRHTVKATINEQVALVEVDQVFYNPTDQRLEGTFQFPLPHGATIARLAMYIGDNLMEGEIAETQRARRTFEALLVQNQDPALLEWVGGNLFKMRVFPIEPKSEKRVLISYYEVLKKVHNRIRFTYPLVSDALQKKPVGKVEVTVNVKSTPQLVDSRCPSHKDAELVMTKNGLDVLYKAEKTRPEKDFRVEYDLAPDQGDLVVVPFWHAKANEGYFMMIFSPTLKETASEKDKANNFIFVVDKSGGLGSRHLALGVRAVKEALRYLKPTDRFGIVAYDTFAKAFAPALCDATPDKVAEAKTWLDGLEAMGASDLSRAWQAAAQLTAGNEAHLLYVGNGLSSLTSTRTGKLIAEAQNALTGADVRIHCLALGDVQDAGFLGELAKRFRGTLRMVGGADDADLHVGELLEDFNWPLYRNVEVSFQGLDVEEIYPVQLPHVTAGRQLFVFGKYRTPWSGVVKLTAMCDDADYEREFEADLGAKTDARFVPRLWATRKIDHHQLVAGLVGGEEAGKLQRTVIETSKRYRVMSRFTSFIVLETAEDYERFGIERRQDEFEEMADADGAELLEQAKAAPAKSAMEALAKAPEAKRKSLIKSGGYRADRKELQKSAQQLGQRFAANKFKAPPAPEQLRAAEKNVNAIAEPELAAATPRRRARKLENRDFVADRKALKDGRGIDSLAWARKDIFPTFSRPHPGKGKPRGKAAAPRAMEILNGLAKRFESLAFTMTRFTLDKEGKEKKSGREWIAVLDRANNRFMSRTAGADHFDICDGKKRVRFYPQLKYAALREATVYDLASIGALLPGYLFPWAAKLDFGLEITVESETEKEIVLRLTRPGDPRTYTRIVLAGAKGPVTRIEIFRNTWNRGKRQSLKTQTVVCEEVKDVNGLKIPTVYRVTNHQQKGHAATTVTRLTEVQVNFTPKDEIFKIEIPKDWAIRDLRSTPGAKERRPVSRPINPSTNFGGRRR